MQIFLCFFLAASLFFVPARSSANELPKIAVWDLEAANIPGPYTRVLTANIVSEVVKLQKYEVYSQENIRTLAGWTAEKMKLGCTETQCLTALGQMDIAKLISGNIGKVGRIYSVSLSLFNTQNARAENAVSQECQSEDDLIPLVRQAVRKLLGESSEIMPAAAPPQPVVIKEGLLQSAPGMAVGSRFVFQQTNVKGRNVRTYSLILKEKKDYGKKPAYWFDVSGGKAERFEVYDLNLNFVAIFRMGKEVHAFIPSLQRLSWPVQVGKVWKTVHDEWDVNQARRINGINGSGRVLAYEDVRVPAGTFKAFKIFYEWATVARETFWFAPQIASRVKIDREQLPNHPAGPGRSLHELKEYTIPLANQ